MEKASIYDLLYIFKAFGLAHGDIRMLKCDPGAETFRYLKEIEGILYNKLLPKTKIRKVGSPNLPTS